MHEIGVSVCVFSYNFEKYIATAIDSVLSQKTTFPIEIIIGDDFSTDDTRSIILEYHSRYPEVIRLNFSSTNVGGTNNWISTIEKARGKYVALLDGDDLFLDPTKLQSQYEFLENNTDYTFCFHGVEEFYDDSPELNKITIFPKETYTISDFLELGWFVRTGSTFFKNHLLPTPFPTWVYDYPYRFDTILQVMLTMHGKAYNIKKVMSKWRRHSQGLSYVITQNYIDNNLKVINLSKQLDAFTQFQHHSSCHKHQRDLYASLALSLLRHSKLLNSMLYKSCFKAGIYTTFKIFKRDYLS